MYKESWSIPYSVDELEDIWEEVPAIIELPKVKSNFDKALEGMFVATVLILAMIGAFTVIKGAFFERSQASYYNK